MADERPILLIDGSNIYAQAHHAFSTLSVTGKQMGAYAGFLSMLARYIREMSPSAVYVAWEHNSAKMRRQIYPGYKATRIPLNDDEAKSRAEQFVRLIRTLRHTAICQIYIEGCEGDDVIAFLCRNMFQDRRKIIVSSDQDFYQLLDPLTTIYSPLKRMFVDHGSIPRMFCGILAENFAIYKALCGDGSDNVPGIKGIGAKKAAKLFPDLARERVDLDVIYAASGQLRGAGTLYRRVHDSFEDIRIYWKIMQLEETMLTAEQCQRVRAIIEQHRGTDDIVALTRMLAQDSVSFNHELFIEAMSRIRKIDA